jgi:hypothetical protein
MDLISFFLIKSDLISLLILLFSTPKNPPYIFFNIRKKEKYQKNIGTIKFFFLKAFDDNDQALLDKYKTLIVLWVYLKTKYIKPSKLIIAKYTKNLNNFSWNNKLTIIDTWNKLKNT